MTSQITLASGSAARRDLLKTAGVKFQVDVPRIDEAAIIASLLAEGAKPRDIADNLAELKARRVASKNLGGLVIGADQVLVCEGEVFTKPPNIDAARKQLRTLRGRGHQLLSAVVVFENQDPVWRCIGRAQLAMRKFSDRFLEEYLEDVDTEVLSSVGCYKLETTGAQLFSSVQGDYFTILGLPLIEVLGFLRSRGALKV